MSHEPGRERYITYRCESCHGWFPLNMLTHREEYDEYWCDNCIDNANEAAYDRQQEANLSEPPESANEEAIRTWEEHQKAHRR